MIHHERLRPPSRDCPVDECRVVRCRRIMPRGRGDSSLICSIPTEVDQLDIAALADGALRARPDPEADPDA
jgi:hypothetical protein